MGFDDGTVCNPGCLLGPRVYTGDRRELLHPAGPAGQVGWNEPEGRVFQIAADNLDRLKNEIYRVSYLMQQAGDGSGPKQSGLSKQWDFRVTQEILGAFGDVMKDSIRNVLNRIVEARRDALTIDVVGLDPVSYTHLRA